MIFTIVITAYNRKKYLLDSLKSALCQKNGVDFIEIILIKNFLDKEIDNFCEENFVKNIIMEGSVGQFLAKGISESKGDLISFLDDDDLFIENKVSYILSLSKRYNFDYLHNNYEEMDEFGNKRSSFMRKAHFTSYNFDIASCNLESSYSDLKKIYSKEIDFNISCITISRNLGMSILDKLKKVTACQDGFLFFSALQRGNVLATGHVLTKYRIHTSTSTNVNNIDLFSKNLCWDGLRQIESMKQITPEGCPDSFNKLFYSFLTVKKLKILTFNCIHFKKSVGEYKSFLKVALTFNTLSKIWFLLYTIGIIFPNVTKKLIFRYVKMLVSE